MTKQVQVLFANDQQVATNETVKQFVTNSSGTFSTLVMDDEIVVVVKEVKEEKQTTEEVRMLAGSISRELCRRKTKQAEISEDSLSRTFNKLSTEKIVTAFVEGWHLGSYTFSTYQSKKVGNKTTLSFNNNQEIDTAIQLGEKRAEATAFSRDLMNELSNVLNPDTFPEVLKEEFEGTDVDVTIHSKADLEKMEMNGVLTVGRGSTYEPAFVEMTYQTDKTKPVVALVGKGVTFDTGGISLKHGRDLSDMRMDMGGAAAVAGAMKLLATTNAQVNVVALIPIVENMPDRKSLIPGEVITYKNGHTVQVGNTDAEGRLILADGLIRAEELAADYIVDIATLTGAVVNALGTKLGGIFGDDRLASIMKGIGEENGDFNWQLPLVDAYESYLKSDYADFSNISSKGEAGSITAALFLRKFVTEPSKWLHVDMAGVMESQATGYYAKSATGFGARLLADFTNELSE